MIGPGVLLQRHPRRRLRLTGGLASLLTLFVFTLGLHGAAAADPPIVLTETSTDRFSDLVIDHPCTGEGVILEGTATALVHFTQGEQMLNFRRLFTVHGSGVGTVSGERYTFHLISSSVTNLDPSDLEPNLQVAGPFSTTFVSAGDEPNFVAQALLHLVTTPSGQELAIQFEDARCL
jgi:hypothetical protein